MPFSDADLRELSRNIENAIKDGFENAVRSGGLGTPGGGRRGDTGDRGSAFGGGGGGGTTDYSARVAAAAEASSAAQISAQQGLFDQLFEVGVKGTSAVAAGFDKFVLQQNTGFIRAYDDLLETYGGEFREISPEEFFTKNLSDISNEGTRAIAESFREVVESSGQELFAFMDPDEALDKYNDFIKTLGSTNINLIKQNTGELQSAAIRFSKSMGIQSAEVGELVATHFAETGETSQSILNEITTNAEAVGRAAGIPLKEMASQITEVKLDMDTFTDITIASAARMTASLKQLGLSVPQFKRMMEPFRDFDTAATKMGDMSALFGVQMDAMEMMYLANEDEEEFLHRMREQLLDQGLDVETMSKTRQRALAEQLGLPVKEMKMFMQGTMDVAEASELMGATGEASTKTQTEALEMMNDNMKVLGRTTGELANAALMLQEAFSAPGISNAIQNLGEIGAVIVNTATETENLGGKVTKTQGELVGVMSTFSGQAKDLATSIVPEMSAGASDGIDVLYDTISNLAGKNMTPAFDAGAENLKMAAESSKIPARSFPYWLYPLRDAIKYPGSPEVAALMNETFQKMFKNMEASLLDSAEGISFEDPFTTKIEELAASTKTQFDALAEEINKATIGVEIDSIEPFINSEPALLDAAAMVDDLNAVLAGIDAPEIDVEVSSTVEATTATLAADVSEAVSSATIEIVEKFNKTPTPVEVSFDLDQVKKDLVAALVEGLTTGFNELEPHFTMNMDSTKFADLMAKSTTSKSERFKLMG